MEGKAHFKIAIVFGIIPMIILLTVIYYYLYTVTGCIICLIWSLLKNAFWIFLFVLLGVAFPDFDWKFGRHRHPLFHSGIIPLIGFVIWITDTYIFLTPVSGDFLIIFSSFSIGYALHLISDIIPPGDTLRERIKKLIGYIKRNDAPGNITGIKKEFTWLSFWGITLFLIGIFLILVIFI